MFDHNRLKRPRKLPRVSDLPRLISIAHMGIFHSQTSDACARARRAPRATAPARMAPRCGVAGSRLSSFWDKPH